MNIDLQQKQVKPEVKQEVSRGTPRTFIASAYCPCKICCGKSTGITASGTHATQGRTIAVDPKIIPLGTKVWVNGKQYIAEDTGGAIKGNKIDIYFNSHQDALNWGIKKVKVEW